MAITVNQVVAMEQLIKVLDDHGKDQMLAEILRARDNLVKAEMYEVADVFNELYCIVDCA